MHPWPACTLSLCVYCDLYAFNRWWLFQMRASSRRWWGLSWTFTSTASGLPTTPRWSSPPSHPSQDTSASRTSYMCKQGQLQHFYQKHWESICFSALTTVLSACLTKGSSFPLAWVTNKNSWPTLAKDSCYLGPGGRAANHLCPCTNLVYKLNSTLRTANIAKQR